MRNQDGNPFHLPGRLPGKRVPGFGFRDAWAVGLSRDFLVAVWCGNADGEGRPGLTGTTAAAPLMFDVFSLLPAGKWFHFTGRSDEGCSRLP